MSEAKPLEMSEEENAQLQRQIFSSGKKLHENSEQLMTVVERFIELTEGDLSLVIDDLKRASNFLDAVIEAFPIKHKLSEIMILLKLDEPIVRKLFKDVGVDLDESVRDPDETIIRKDVIALFADRAGSQEGDLLAVFLRGDSPEVVWG